MKKFFLAVIILIIIFFISSILLYSDPESRFFVAKMLGLKDTPKAIDELVIKELAVGLHGPTSIAFYNDDLFFLQKNDGLVRLIRNEEIQEKPLLDFNVNDLHEGGLLGILVDKPYVYFYLTESTRDGEKAIADNIYRYQWTGENFVESTLINSFSVNSGWHHGGAMTMDKNGNIYLIRGDQRDGLIDEYGILQNNPRGEMDDTGVIIRVGMDDSHLTPALSPNPLDHYYAIGIRNSFGLATDPVTGFIWDTENGDKHFDEINLVFPKFNSGWNNLMGFANSTQLSQLPSFYDFIYSDPEFSWEHSVAPTALTFAPIEWKNKYSNSLFVADCRGNLYNFKLNTDRTGFIFEEPGLFDLVLNEVDNFEEILLLKGLGCISDIEFGPDKNLYIVSHANNGVIYKVKFEM